MGKAQLLNYSIHTMAVAYAGDHTTSIHNLSYWGGCSSQINRLILLLYSSELVGRGIRFAFLPTADTLGGVQLPFQESSQDWNTCYFYEAILFTNFPLSQLCEGMFRGVAATFTFLPHVHKGRVIALSVRQFVHGVSVDTKLHSLSELGTLATFSFNG